MWGISLVSKLQLGGSMGTVKLYHEMELFLAHGCHEIQNVMCPTCVSFGPGWEHISRDGFLQSKFKRSDYEHYCFIHLITSNHEAWSLRDVLSAQPAEI